MPSSVGPSPTFAALLLFVDIGLTGYGAYDYQQSSTMEDAVEVNATVTGASVETVTSNRSPSPKPTGSFTYRYEGEPYTSNLPDESHPEIRRASRGPS